MGEVLSSLFPDPSLLPGGPAFTKICALANSTNPTLNTSAAELLNCSTSPIYGFLQLLVLFGFYAYVLFVASNLISEGSELLTLVPSVKHIVGSIVLPVLGAVPDGAIVLFSGLGPIEGVQNAVKVGVGALAGSTIMLLTIPWFMSILAGQVPIENGKPIYSKRKRAALERVRGNRCTCCSHGVESAPVVKTNGIIMAMTLLAYIIVQIPALTIGSHGIAANETPSVEKVEAENIKYYALIAFIVATLSFIAYLIYSAKNTGESTNKEARGNLTAKLDFIGAKHVRASAVDIVSLFHAEFVALRKKLKGKKRKRASLAETMMENSDTSVPQPLIQLRERLNRFMFKFFQHHDRDSSGNIDLTEYSLLADTLGVSKKSDIMSFDRMDTDGNGKISYREFAETLMNYIENFDKHKIELMQRPPMAPEFTVHAVLGPDTPSSVQVTTLASQEIPANPLSTSNESLEQEDFPLTVKEIPFQNLEGDEEEEDEEEEEEEATDDLYDIDEATGQRVLNLSRVKLRSFKLMAIGTIIVVLFSDPMCDILSEFGERLNIDAFYISFVLAPLASNASEVIASYAFARKKTRSSIAVSFTQLEGAGIMNNTFCVAIFLILIYARGLAWEFTAETTSIVVIELLMMFMAFKKVHLYTPFFVLVTCHLLCCVDPKSKQYIELQLNA